MWSASSQVLILDDLSLAAHVTLKEALASSRLFHLSNHKFVRNIGSKLYNLFPLNNANLSGSVAIPLT